MLEGKQISVVVPAYNEEILIKRVIETMPDFVDTIYVVDDYSRDNTRDQVRSQIGSNGHLKLLEHSENQGVGAAIVTGYKKAIEDNMDVVAVMAGDAQMAPEELESVVRPVVREEVHYVKGNRLFTGEAWQLIPSYRYMGNAFLSLLTKIASGYWHVADSQTGYTAISSEAIRLIPLHKLYPRYGYPNHLLIMLNAFGLRVRDVPVRPVYNIGEKSGIRLWKVIPTISWLLFKNFVWRLKEKYIIRDFHPLVFFYVLGFFFGVATLGLSARLVMRWYLDGFVPPVTALASMFSFMSSSLFTLFAMWFDMEVNKSLK